MCRGAFYQAVHEQPFGSAEDTVKDDGIGDLPLLLLVHNSFHKQLQGREILCSITVFYYYSSGAGNSAGVHKEERESVVPSRTLLTPT